MRRGRLVTITLFVGAIVAMIAVTVSTVSGPGGQATLTMCHQGNPSDAALDDAILLPTDHGYELPVEVVSMAYDDDAVRIVWEPGTSRSTIDRFTGRVATSPLFTEVHVDDRNCPGS